MSESYEQYEPPEQVPEEGERWCVLVEHENRGTSRSALRIMPGTGTHTEAMAEAARLAFEYRPPDPRSPRRRQVFQVQDGYLVILTGATSIFHMTVRAARIVGEADY